MNRAESTRPCGQAAGVDNPVRVCDRRGALDHASLCGIQPEGPEWRLRALPLSLVGRTDLPQPQPRDKTLPPPSTFPRFLVMVSTYASPAFVMSARGWSWRHPGTALAKRRRNADMPRGTPWETITW